MDAIIVAVVGAGVADDATLQLAHAVGAGIARHGWILVTGGRGGVMAAASRGAAEQGGLVVGVLPGPDRKEANPWVAIPLATGLGHARNAVIAQAADALVAVGGSHGTLSEMALGLKMGKPVVALNDLSVPGVERAEDVEDALARLVTRLTGTSR